MKIKNIGICGSDIHAYYGKHPFMSFPIRLGHEMAGEIVEVGADVKDIKVGDRVSAESHIFCGECFFCKNDMRDPELYAQDTDFTTELWE